MRPLCLILSLCSITGTALASGDSLLWRFAHPGARAMAGLDWRRVLDSPVGRELKRELENSDLATAPEGFNVLTDVERVLLSSPGKRPGMGKNDAPVVIAVEGRFNLAEIRKSALGNDVTSRTYQSVEIIAPKRKDGDRMALALVNEHIVLFGDTGCVEAAIAGGTAPALSRRALELARDNEFWIVADSVPWDLAANRAPQLAMLREITGIDAAVSLRQGLGLTFNLVAKSRESAQSIAGSLGMLLNMASLQAKERPEVASLLRKLTIVSDEATVKLAMSVDEAELERGMASFRAQRPELRIRAAVRGDLQTPVAPAEPEKKSIFVHGLEGGPREIPYGTR